MTRIIICILAIAATSLSASAYSDHRGHNIDSLETVVAPWTSDRLANASDEEYHNLVSACEELMSGYMQINRQASMFYGRKAYSLAIARGYLNTAVSALKGLGQHHWAAEQYDSAAFYFNQAVSLVDRMAAGEHPADQVPYGREIIDDCYSKLYGAIGNLYNMMGDIPTAMDYYARAGEIFERNGWNESNSVLWYNIGETYLDEGDPDKAREAYEKALDYATTASDSLLSANAYKGLGEYYLAKGKTYKALEYLQKAEDYYSNHSEELYSRFETYDFIGQCYEAQKQQYRFTALVAFGLIAVLLILLFVLGHMRRLKRRQQGADEVIDSAIQDMAKVIIDEDEPSESPLNYEEPFLTEREEEILPLLAGGLTSAQIADKLCLSLPTIKWYRKRLLQKFDASNTADLIFKAKEKGLI